MSEEKKKTSFDLMALDTTENSEAGAWLHLLGPDEKELYHEGRPIRVLLMGADSKEYQKLQHRQTTNRVNAMSKVGKRSKKADWGEEFYEGNIDLIVKATKQWENFVYNGETLECTPPNVRMIYERLVFIRDQVFDFVNDWSNYLGN